MKPSRPNLIHVRSRLKLAIVTGYASSAVTLILTLFGIPLVAVRLSSVDFAVYLAVAAFSAISTWGQIGGGPALTQRIAAAAAREDDSTVRSEVAASLYLSLLSAAIVLPISAYLIASGTFQRFYGLNRASSSVVQLCCWLVVGNATIALLASPFVRLQSAFHENHLRNLGTLAANIFTIVGLVWVLGRFPAAPVATSSWMIPGAVLEIGCCVLVLTQHYRVFQKFGFPSAVAFRTAILDSLLFTIDGGGSFAQREFLKGNCGRHYGVRYLTLYIVMLQLATMMQSFANTIIVPMLPALASLRHQDSRSAHRMLAKSFKVVALTGLASVLLGYMAGPTIFDLWMKGKYELAPASMSIVAALGTAYVLRSLSVVGLISYGMQGWMALASLCSAGATVGAYLVLKPGSLVELVAIETVSVLIVYTLVGVLLLRRSSSLVRLSNGEGRPQSS